MTGPISQQNPVDLIAMGLKSLKNLKPTQELQITYALKHSGIKLIIEDPKGEGKSISIRVVDKDFIDQIQNLGPQQIKEKQPEHEVIKKLLEQIEKQNVYFKIKSGKDVQQVVFFTEDDVKAYSKSLQPSQITTLKSEQARVITEVVTQVAKALSEQQTVAPEVTEEMPPIQEGKQAPPAAATATTQEPEKTQEEEKTPAGKTIETPEQQAQKTQEEQLQKTRDIEAQKKEKDKQVQEKEETTATIEQDRQDNRREPTTEPQASEQIGQTDQTGDRKTPSDVERSKPTSSEPVKEQKKETTKS